MYVKKGLRTFTYKPLMTDIIRKQPELILVFREEHRITRDNVEDKIQAVIKGRLRMYPNTKYRVVYKHDHALIILSTDFEETFVFWIKLIYVD